jgi:hypothetical protein
MKNKIIERILEMPVDNQFKIKKLQEYALELCHCNNIEVYPELIGIIDRIGKEVQKLGIQQ